MIKFTLDTNCIIDLEELRESAPALRTLVAKHRLGEANVALVAVSASERQPGDTYLSTYSDFVDRVAGVGLQDLPHIMGMSYFDLSFIDCALLVSDAMLQREEDFHAALFPSIHFDSAEHAKEFEAESPEERKRQNRKWRNAWCDRQMIWAHENAGRDVFVTSDRNFKKKLTGRAEFTDLRIATPSEALSLI